MRRSEPNFPEVYLPSLFSATVLEAGRRSKEEVRRTYDSSPRSQLQPEIPTPESPRAIIFRSSGGNLQGCQSPTLIHALVLLTPKTGRFFTTNAEA